MPKINKKHRSRLNLSLINIEAVLPELGMKFRKNGDELYAFCPNVEHVKEKHPTHWHIRSKIGDERNGVFLCWSCKFTGNIIKLVSVLKEIDFQKAVEFLSPFVGTAPIRLEIEKEDYEKNLGSYEPQSIPMLWNGKKIETEKIDPDSECFAYLQSRWIGQKYINMFGIVDWKEQKRIFVPITRNGKMVSWIARSYNGKNPKTFAPKGAPKKWELFGLDQIDRSVPEVNLCEGWVDAIRLMQAGIMNPLATCGSVLSEYQADELSFAKRLTLWRDGDKAGQIFGIGIAAWLGRGREFFVVKFPAGTDPGYYQAHKLKEFQPECWIC